MRFCDFHAILNLPFFLYFFSFLSRLAGNFMHSSATRGKDRLPFFSALVKLSTFSCIFVLFSPYFWLLCSTFVAKWPYYFGYHVVKSPCFELLLDVLSSLSQRLCWDIVVEPKQYQATSMLHGKNRNTFSFSHPLECGKLSKKKWMKRWKVRINNQYRIHFQKKRSSICFAWKMEIDREWRAKMKRAMNKRAPRTYRTYIITIT